MHVHVWGMVHVWYSVCVCVGECMHVACVRGGGTYFLLAMFPGA